MLVPGWAVPACSPFTSYIPDPDLQAAGVRVDLADHAAPRSSSAYSPADIAGLGVAQCPAVARSPSQTLKTLDRGCQVDVGHMHRIAVAESSGSWPTAGCRIWRRAGFRHGRWLPRRTHLCSRPHQCQQSKYRGYPARPECRTRAGADGQVAAATLKGFSTAQSRSRYPIPCTKRSQKVVRPPAWRGGSNRGRQSDSATVQIGHPGVKRPRGCTARCGIA